MTGPAKKAETRSVLTTVRVGYVLGAVAGGGDQTSVASPAGAAARSTPTAGARLALEDDELHARRTLEPDASAAQSRTPSPSGVIVTAAPVPTGVPARPGIHGPRGGGQPVLGGGAWGRQDRQGDEGGYRLPLVGIVRAGSDSAIPRPGWNQSSSVAAGGRRRKLLVANRGEIAVRIFSTCRRLGIGDGRGRRAGRRGRAPRARRRHASSRSPSYLDADALVAPRANGARARPPGYGFLAESASFAEAVVEAGLTWVGPPAGRPASRRRQARGEADRSRRGRPDAPDRRSGGARLPAARQGGGGRRRSRDAGRRDARRPRRRPRVRGARGRGGVR